jgi:hypothetical protein
VRHVLAIDQGTTGSTCLVVAEDGRVVARGSFLAGRPFTCLTPGDGRPAAQAGTTERRRAVRTPLARPRDAG